MAKAKDTANSEPAAKRAKTGGRPPRKSIDEQIAEAERRSRLAALHDNTTVEAPLAAFYLCMSMSQLREHRGTKLPSEEDKKAARLAKVAEAAAKAAGRAKSKSTEEVEEKPKGLRMIKIAEKGAVGSNQPVTYLLGDLRKFQLEHAGYDTFEVTLAANGLLGWVSEPAPFLASPKPDRKGRPVVMAPAWSLGLDAREKRLGEIMAGKARCVWLTPAEAVHCVWANESEHKKFAKPWLALLKDERQAAKASIERSALFSISNESSPSKVATKSI